MNEKQEPSISERLEEIFALLTHDQLRFITAMLESKSKKEAAEKIDIKPATVYCWDNAELVNEAIRLIQLEPLESARRIRRGNLVKAMMVKSDGLNSDDEKVRQSTATEIIEWELGKAKQAIEHTGENGAPITIVEVIKAKNGNGTIPTG